MIKKLAHAGALICTLLFLSLASCTQKNTSDTASETTETLSDDQIIQDFIVNMYDNALYADYDFLKTHCARELLAKLEADYDYETDETAYAVWDFRTSAQDSKPGSDAKSEVIAVTPDGDGWYTYEFYDGGWLGKNRLKCHLQDGKVVLDAVESLYDECLSE